MNQPETSESPAEDEAQTVPDAGEAAAPAEPEPEPWTPERALEWNHYYDLYLVAGVLLLVFVTAAHKIASPILWPLMEAGKLISARGLPIVRDHFSYTRAGERWINIPWLFEWANYQLYRLPAQLGTSDQAPRYGAWALVGLNATIRMLTALALLGLRRPGPGLWWGAVCVAVVLGGFFGPQLNLGLGGIAGSAEILPETWGLLLLALELLLLHWAYGSGRRGALYALVPLFLIWANVDESFPVGLLILATTALGSALDHRKLEKPGASETETRPAPGLVLGLVVLAVSAGVCLINPSHLWIVPAAFRLQGFSIGTLIGRLSLRQKDPIGWLYAVQFLMYYVILVGLGLASFALNRRRSSWERFLTFAAVAIGWGFSLLTLSGPFALVLGAAVALNGQEWYLGRFGAEGRIGRAWSAWSIGGRAITILVLCLFLFKGLTGYGSRLGEPVFGFGVEESDFAFEAADYLRSAPISGPILNTTHALGDALIWRTDAQRPTFIDDRRHLFPAALEADFLRLRIALRDGDETRWQEVLHRYQVPDINVVMLFMGLNPILGEPSPKTYQGLRKNPNWIPFYDDGNVVMFGRADAPKADRDYFETHRLDADTLVYHRQEPLTRVPERPPSAVTSLDRVFQRRWLTFPQPHVLAARRWLNNALKSEQGAGPAPSQPDPALCYMAVREARIALAEAPDDPDAPRILAEAYGNLLRFEAALIQNQAAKTAPELLLFRVRQQLTALNQAIQTSPPPRTAIERIDLRQLHLTLAELYQSLGNFDLTRDHLRAARTLSQPGEFTFDAQTTLSTLDKTAQQVQDHLRTLADSQQADPLQRVQLAITQGMVGMAITELEDLGQSQGGIYPPQIKALLIRLYCETGQPEKVLDLTSEAGTPDSQQADPPGTNSYRQGLISLLLGYYSLVQQSWQDALWQCRWGQSHTTLIAGRTLLEGNPRPASDAFLRARSQFNNEIVWEFQLALALLESGDPLGAGSHFENVLKLDPSTPYRPVIAYYLEKLGRPVPPAPEPKAESPPTSSPAEVSNPSALPPSSP